MPSPTQKVGAELERTAEAILSRRGYRILARNWRGAGGELDRVAWDGDCLCFVEVRFRERVESGSPVETVTLAKRRMLARTARAFLAAYFSDAAPNARFDVVGLVREEDGSLRAEIVTDAFDEAGRVL
ncbi:MAG: YraN family protein [Myxococcota bacterium]